MMRFFKVRLYRIGERECYRKSTCVWLVSSDLRPLTFHASLNSEFTKLTVAFFFLKCLFVRSKLVLRASPADTSVIIESGQISSWTFTLRRVDLGS